MCLFFFFFNDTATTEIYTLSLHDALPISDGVARRVRERVGPGPSRRRRVRKRPVRSDGDDAACRSVELRRAGAGTPVRSEEHTSELQSRQYLVCRLLLEKKKKYKQRSTTS